MKLKKLMDSFQQIHPSLAAVERKERDANYIK